MTGPSSTGRGAGATTCSAGGSNGTWHRVVTRLQPRADARGATTWDLSVDSTVCRAHQPAAGTVSRVTCRKDRRVFTEPCDHGLGRSRGGFTTELHRAVEQVQKPMAMVTAAGQRGESPQFEPVLEKVRVLRIGPGRPRVRPDRVRADKAYAFRRNRAYLRRRGIRCTIPDKADQTRIRWKLGSRGGRRSSLQPTAASARRPSAGSTVSRDIALSPRATTSWQSVSRRPCWLLRSTNGYDSVSRVIRYVFPMSGSPYMKNSTKPSC